MAIRQSAASGNADVGATWSGGVAPGAGDTFEVLTGHEVTFTANMTVLGWTQKGSGRLILNAGVKLTATAGPMMVEGDGTNTAKVVLASGAELLAAPATGVTITLILGVDYYKYAEVETRGTAGSRCKIGKVVGSLGTFDIRHNVGGIVWMYGVLDCEYTDFIGVGTIDLSPRHHGKLILKNCTVTTSGQFVLVGYDMDPGSYSGSMLFEDTVFSNYVTIQGNGTDTALTIRRCEFMDELLIGWPGGASPGMFTFHENIVHFRFIGSWRADLPAKSDIRGCFFYHRSAKGTTGQYNFRGIHLDCYAFADYRDHADQVNGGNPHFWSMNASSFTQTLDGCVIEYRGPAGPDTGDAGDLHAGNMTVKNTIVLASDNAGVSSGAFWLLGGVGLLDVDHCTIHTGSSGGVRFPHNQTVVADQVRIRNSLFWNDSGISHAVYNDSPSTAATDCLPPANLVGNAFVGLADGTNKVNGVDTTINGVEACEFSASPTGNTSLPVNGAAFADDEVGLLKWASEELGLTGTPDQLRDGALDAIRADKSLVASSLIPYVRIGYTPGNMALATVAADGTTPGVMAAAEGAGGGGEEEDTLDPARLAYWEGTIIQRHSSGSLPYLPGEGYNYNANEHYDVIECMYQVRDYNIRNGRVPTNWTEQIAAGIDRFRDQCILTDAFDENGEPSLLPGHVVYTTGMRHHWQETGDPLDVEAINHIKPLDNGYVPRASYESYYRNVWDNVSYQRDNYYKVKASLDRRRVGLPKHEYQDVEADICLNLIDHYVAPTTQRYGAVTRAFVMGMGLRAFVDYWNYFNMEATPDANESAILARIPGAVRAALDHIWAKCWWAPGPPHLGEDEVNTWSQGSLKYVYPSNVSASVQPLTGFTIATVTGPNRFTASGTLSSVNDYYKYLLYIQQGDGRNPDKFVRSYNGTTKEFTIGGQSITPVVGNTFTLDVEDNSGKDWASPALNLLVAHAYAWMYWYQKVVLGDEATGLIYKDRHDTMFNGAATAWQMPFSQKEWNQSKLVEPTALLVREQADAGIDYRTLEGGGMPETPVDSYTFTRGGPSSGLTGETVGPLTIALGTGGVPSPIVFTFAVSGVTGSFANPTRTLSNSLRSASTVFTPLTAGTATISVTNDGGLPNPPSVTYTVTAPVPSPIVPIPPQTFLPTFIGSRMRLIVPRN